MVNSKKCPSDTITVSQEREIILSDHLAFPWSKDPKGYFLVKIENGCICCGFVNHQHTMEVELKGKNVEKMIKEIARRKLCSTFETMGYIAAELMIAKDALEKNKKYVQR